MSARFAGSQRVGDRRRRRLAVEADGGADYSIPRQDLPAPEGISRTIDPAHTEPAAVSESPGGPFPIAQIIPIERWKYAVAGLVILAFNGMLVAVGWLTPKLSVVAGPAVARLFAPVDGTAMKWWSSLLLGLSAQLAILIWWARSRSLKDFEGRYWLWTRAAAIWLAFSGCVAVEAGQAAVDVLRHFRPDLSPAYAALAWLIPSLTIGFAIARGLYGEMSGCRASRMLFMTAVVFYVLAAGCDLEFVAAIGSRMQSLLVQVGLLTGHSLLFSSMMVHARHVIHRSADPAQVRKRAWRIPRPHFRMPNIRGFKKKQRPDADAADVTETIATTSPKSRRSHPRDPDSMEPATREPVASERVAATPAAESTTETPNAPPVDTKPSKPRFRIDTRHDQPVELREVAAVRDVSPVEEPSTPEREQEADDSPSRPDLRGMSKKQRRRIMQELRDKERAAREE